MVENMKAAEDFKEFRRLNQVAEDKNKATAELA